MNIESFIEYSVPLPVEKKKRILRKCTSEKFYFQNV